MKTAAVSTRVRAGPTGLRLGGRHRHQLEAQDPGGVGRAAAERAELGG